MVLAALVSVVVVAAVVIIIIIIIVIIIIIHKTNMAALFVVSQRNVRSHRKRAETGTRFLSF